MRVGRASLLLARQDRQVAADTSHQWQPRRAKSKDEHDTRIRGPFRDGKYRYEPLQHATVEIEDCCVMLEQRTLRNLLGFASWGSRVARFRQYANWRPASEIPAAQGKRLKHGQSAGPAAREWWRFARRCIDHDNKVQTVKHASTQAELVAAIGDYTTIALTADISLVSSTYIQSSRTGIVIENAQGLVINGSGFAIDGQGMMRCMYVASADVALAGGRDLDQWEGGGLCGKCV